MDGVIEALASGLGNGIGWLAESGVLFIVFAVLWVAFAIGIVWNQGGLDQAWSTIRSQPLLVQGAAWLLFLPVTAGLWVWETTWPFVVRLLVVGGIAGWNLLVFLPKAFRS